jgi:hypothetical protein
MRFELANISEFTIGGDRPAHSLTDGSHHAVRLAALIRNLPKDS